MKLFLLLFLLLISHQDVVSKVTLPGILSSGMVLQQNSKVKLWGWSDSNKSIRIKTSWTNAEFVADVHDGKWEIFVDTDKAGGPYKITFNDGEILELNDIYLGEVWLCSGQSNMEMPLCGFMGQPVINSIKTIANANPSVPIRLFNVKKCSATDEQIDCQGEWMLNTPDNVSGFSAVAYYYGLQLYQSLNVPIGLVCSSWGGTIIQAWMSKPTIHNNYPKTNLSHLKDKSVLKKPYSCTLYNGMIYPLKDFVFRGVIWYQGESNKYNVHEYKSLFQDFVNDWRKLFKNDTLPFYYAQIAPYKYNDKNGIESALVREAQFESERTVSNVKMAVLMDIGDEHCIHPAYKNTVGDRLAFLALHHTYNTGVYADSPRFKSIQIKDNRILIDFEDAPLGITSFGKQIKNFEIAGDDGVFYPAKALIVDRKYVEIWNDKIKKPFNIRYAFKNYVCGELFGMNGMPVSSFRTDN